MISKEKLIQLLPDACNWAKNQEQNILKSGIPLSEDQQIDAYLIGIKEIKRIKLLKVDKIPTPSLPELKNAAQTTGLLTSSTIGISFRYGIYIRSDFWNKRELVVHELTHTMQYERLGSFEKFLEQYLEECITVGYPYGSLEQEVIKMEKKICT